jgi:hypothetical protein
MVEAAPSKNAIDRLGDRLRISDTPDDLRMLNECRNSFSKAFEAVLRQIYIAHGF